LKGKENSWVQNTGTRYLNGTVEKESAAVELDDNHVKTVGPCRPHRLLAVSLLREQGIEFPQLLQVLCRIKGLIKKKSAVEFWGQIRNFLAQSEYTFFT
jgi:hypothetical protein